jgi:hypothetical protein
MVLIGQILAAQVAVDLHQTTGVGGHDVLGAGFLDGGDFHFIHGIRDHRELH